MKPTPTPAIVLSIFLALSACGSTQQGAGFSGIGTEPKDAAVPARTVASANRAPATHQNTYALGGGATPQTVSAAPQIAGVPSFAMTSRNVKKGRAPLRGAPAANSAGAYMSSRWGEGYSVPLSVDDITGRMRLVTVDGAPHLVVGKLKRPFFARAMTNKKLGQTVSEAAARQAGCQPVRGYYVKTGSYNSPVAVITPVNCG